MKPMKMKELEARSGIGRETIRFYIREGLLPEPERPKPNVAYYSDEHLQRLAAIKRLQQERFLPLAVIKTILRADPNAFADNPSRLPHLEHLLAARLDLTDNKAHITMAQASEATGVPEEEIRELAEIGAITLAGKEGEVLVRPVDVAIIGQWARLKEVGINEANGYGPRDLQLYAGFSRTIAETEVKLFMERLSATQTPAKAAEIAQNAIDVSNRLFALMRTKAVLEAISEINARSGVDLPGAAADAAE